MKLVLRSTSRNHKACVRKRVPSVVRFTLAALLAGALLCVGWQPAFAQVSTGSISGSFADVQGGAIVGGPIVRDKMFIFGGFDTDIVSTSTVYNSSNLTPTPAGLATLAGCFVSGPSSAAVSALTRFGPFGQTIGNPVATPTRPNNTFLNQTLAGCPGVQVGGVTRTVSNPNHAYNWVTRWDYQLGSSDMLSARYLFQKTTDINSNFDNPVAGYFVNIPALEPKHRGQ